MKTEEQIRQEARLLEWRAQREIDPSSRAGGNSPLLLQTFPEQRVRTPEGLVPVMRWIEASAFGGALEYRLMEGSAPPERSPGDAVYLVGSESAFDVLAEGYTLAEKERLSEALARLLDVCDDRDAVSLDQIDRVERIVDADDFSPTARLRLRSGIACFLAGQIEPSEFIDAVVERQYYRDSVRELVAERHAERMAIGSP